MSSHIACVGCDAKATHRTRPGEWPYWTYTCVRCTTVILKEWLSLGRSASVQAIVENAPPIDLSIKCRVLS